MQGAQIAKSANAIVHPVITITRTKVFKIFNDLKEVMECAVSASCGKWFHIDAELGTCTKDDWKVLVCARG